MTTWSVTRIREIMLEAGRIAVRYAAAPATELKADRSVVTIADTEIEAFLTRELAGDGAVLVGEETYAEAPERAVEAVRRGVAWVVDPIDGTAPYANGFPTWGVSVGRIEDGVLTDGAIFMPDVGELFLTDGDRVLYAAERGDPATWRFDEPAIMEPLDAPYRPEAMVSLPNEAVKGGRYRGVNPMQSNGCAVYSAMRILTGNYLAYLARVRLWDLAGSMPILWRLGAQLQFGDGAPLTPDVTGGDWVLDAASPRVWKSRDLIYIAHTDRTLAYLREHYQPRPHAAE